MKRIHYFSSLLALFIMQQFEASIPQSTFVPIQEVTNAITHLAVFPTVLIPIITDYAQKMRWVLKKEQTEKDENGIKIHCSNRHIALNSYSSTQIFDLKTLVCIKNLSFGHKLSFSPNGDFFSIKDDNITTWCSKNLNQLNSIKNSYYTYQVFFPRSHYIALAEKSQLTILSYATEPTYKISGTEATCTMPDFIVSIAIDNNEQALAVVTPAEILILHPHSLAIQARWKSLSAYYRSESEICSNNTHLLVNRLEPLIKEYRISIYNINYKNSEPIFDKNNNFAPCGKFLSDNTILFKGEESHTLHRQNFLIKNQKSEIMLQQAEDDPIIDFAISPDKKHIVTLGKESIYLWKKEPFHEVTESSPLLTALEK
jgi:WD40 repeat protein